MKKLFVILTILMLALRIQAQVDEMDSLLTDILGSADSATSIRVKKLQGSFMYFGISSDSRTLYSGREIGDDMLNVNGAAYFFHSSGLFFGATGLWYSQTTPKYNATIATAGYRKFAGTGSNFIFTAAYTRFFFNLKDSISYIPFSNNIGTGFTLKNNWIGSSFSCNILFGKEKAVNFYSGIFTSLKLLKFRKGGSLTLTPELSAFIGPETLYELDPRSDSVNLLYISKEKYGVLNLSGHLPLTLSISNLNIEFKYSLNLPRSYDNAVRYPAKTSISISIGYLLRVNQYN